MKSYTEMKVAIKTILKDEILPFFYYETSGISLSICNTFLCLFVVKGLSIKGEKDKS